MSQVWTMYQNLERTQWLAPEEIEERQLEQVRNLLAHAIVHVPYYRRILPDAGVVPGRIRTMADFRSVPKLSRAQIVQHGDQLVSAVLPPGTSATGKISSSGSSGIPLTLQQTNYVNLVWMALYLRDLEWCGIDPTGTLAGINASTKNEELLRKNLEGVSLPVWMRDLSGLIEMGSAYLMDVRQDPRRQLQWLREIAPDYLLSYPNNLDFLAALISEQGEKIPNLRFIQAVSETLTDDARGRIESAFGVPVKNTYSCSEMGYLASPCPSGAGLHVHAENVVFEVLDGNGAPCGPGQTGTVCVTHLHNYRQWLLRYELDDTVTLAQRPCGCGRGLPLLTSVQGKSLPFFHLGNGRRKNTTGLNQYLREIGGFLQVQVVQKAVDRALVRLVPAHDWDAKKHDQMVHVLRGFFERPLEVQVEVCPKLDPPASGKFQPMVCEIKGS